MRPKLTLMIVLCVNIFIAFYQSFQMSHQVLVSTCAHTWRVTSLCIEPIQKSWRPRSLVTTSISTAVQHPWPMGTSSWCAIQIPGLLLYCFPLHIIYLWCLRMCTLHSLFLHSQLEFLKFCREYNNEFLR